MKKMILQRLFAITIALATLLFSFNVSSFAETERQETILYEGFKAIWGEIGSYDYSHLDQIVGGLNDNYSNTGYSANGWSNGAKDIKVFYSMKKGNEKTFDYSAVNYGITSENYRNAYIRISLTLGNADTASYLHFPIAATSKTSTLEYTGEYWGDLLDLSQYIKPTIEQQEVLIPLSAYKDLNKQYMADNDSGEWITTPPIWDKLNSLGVAVDSACVNPQFIINDLKIVLVTNINSGKSFKYNEKEEIITTLYNGISTIWGEIGSYDYKHLDQIAGGLQDSYVDTGYSSGGWDNKRDIRVFWVMQKGNEKSGIDYDSINYGITDNNFENCYIKVNLKLDNTQMIQYLHFPIASTSKTSTLEYTNKYWGDSLDLSEYIKPTIEQQEVLIPLSAYKDIVKKYLTDDDSGNYVESVPTWNKINGIGMAINAACEDPKFTINYLGIVNIENSYTEKALTSDNLKVGTIGIGETGYVSVFDFINANNYFTIDDTFQNLTVDTTVPGSIGFSTTENSYSADAPWAISLTQKQEESYDKNFGLTEDTLSKKALSFDLYLADGEAYDDINIGFGVTCEATILNYTGRYYGNNTDISPYIEKKNGWQHVVIPMSVYENLEAHSYYTGEYVNEEDNKVPWNKMGTLCVWIRKACENMNIRFKNINIVEEKLINCRAAFTVVDTDGGDLTSLTGGKNVMIKAAAVNEKAEEQNVLFILALYKNNIMEKIEATEKTIPANCGGIEIETNSILLPLDVSSYTIRAFAWDSFDSLLPHIDSVEIN